jgi:hypothetical protein
MTGHGKLQMSWGDFGALHAMNERDRRRCRVAQIAGGLHWVIKFAMINTVAFSVMLMSYHYLVRSTFVRLTLNVREYPKRAVVVD